MGDEGRSRAGRRGAARAIAACLVAGVLGACSGDDGGSGSAPTSAGTPDTADAAWAERPGAAVGPLVSGAAALVDGVFAWTDYVYDDRGANLDDGDRTDLDAAGGDVAYPEGSENTADLVQLQIGLDDGAVVVSAVLQTLDDRSAPVVGVAFDTDDDPTTGAAALPGGAWAPDGPLGVELLAVLRADAGELLRHDDGDWVATPVTVTVDPSENVVEATLPVEHVDPGDATWRAFAVAGVATDAGSWVDGGEPIHDMAFVGDEPEYQWQDYVQADVLAGKAPVDLAAAEIDFGRVAAGATELPDERAPGFHTFLYRSELDLGDGIRAGDDGLELLGRYQPYLVYVPEDGVDEHRALTVFLHGLQQNHLGSVVPGGSYLGTARPLSEELHLLADYARDGLDFAPHNTTVWPLARGEGLFYRGIAEQDVLDVLADASLRLDPDPDRIVLAGGSMGGIGAFRLGALYPDRWSAVVPVIGFAQPDVEPLLANLLGVPIRQINGGQDPLIAAESAAATADLLDELELSYRAWILADRGHEAGGFVYDCVYAQLPALVRDADPAHVRYTVDPALGVDDPATGLRLRHDRAYWVSGIEVADEGELATVEAVSHARERFDVTVRRVDEERTSDPEGADLCGSNPDVSTGDTWRERAVVHERGDALSREARVDITLENVAAIAVDLARAGLDGEGEGEIEVSADGPAEVTLTGLDPGAAVAVGGDERAADAEGTVTLPVPAGTTTLTLS